MCVIVGFSTHVDAAPPPAGPWERVFDKDGVTVDWRTVQGSAMKEIRAAVEVDVPAERLFAALTDVGRYPKFMPPAIESRALGRSGATGRFYLVIDPPVVKKRDYCVEITASRLDGGRLESSWHTFDLGCPATREGIVRMRATEGRWILTPRGSKTFLDYQAFSDPSGALPAWIANRSTARAMREMFDGLVAAARDPRYDGCRGESFGCGKGDAGK